MGVSINKRIRRFGDFLRHCANEDSDLFAFGTAVGHVTELRPALKCCSPCRSRWPFIFQNHHHSPLCCHYLDERNPTRETRVSRDASLAVCPTRQEIGKNSHVITSTLAIHSTKVVEFLRPVQPLQTFALSQLERRTRVREIPRVDVSLFRFHGGGRRRQAC